MMRSPALPAGEVDVSYPKGPDAWLGRTLGVYCKKSRTGGASKDAPTLGVVCRVQGAGEELGHTIAVALDTGVRKRFTVKEARKMLAPMCHQSLRILAIVNGGKYDGHIATVIGKTPKMYKLMDVNDKQVPRVYLLRHERCTLQGDMSPGRQPDSGWLGAMVAGTEVWPAEREVATAASIHEATALLPAEALYPGLGRKGERGPERLATYIGKPKKAGRRRMRWDDVPKGGEVDEGLRSMVKIMSGVLAGTASTRASNWHGYKRHIQTWDPHTPLLPLTCEGVGTWLIRRWWIKGRVSNKTSCNTYVSSLVAHAREAGYNRGAKRPGIDDYENTQLKRVIKVLDDLEEGGKKKAFPLLLSMVRHIREVMGDTVEDRRNFARLVIACICALRGQDHNKGRLTWGNVARVGGQDSDTWSLQVMPGKRHSNVRPTMIAPIMDPEERGELDLDPGRIVSDYVAEMGFKSQSSAAKLFPAVEKGEVNFAKAMNDDDFLKWIKDALLAAGYPADIVRRVTLHSPRAGAVTDWFAAGVRLEVIKEQGRWASDAVLLYLRLSLLDVGRWMAQVLTKKNGDQHGDLLIPIQHAVVKAGGNGTALIDCEERKKREMERLNSQHDIGSAPEDDSDSDDERDVEQDACQDDWQ